MQRDPLTGVPSGGASSGFATAEAALADAFGLTEAEVLITATGVFRRIYFDFTLSALAEDYTGDVGWVAHTIIDQAGNTINCEVSPGNSPTTWGIEDGVGARVTGAGNDSLNFRFTPAQLGIDLQKQGFFFRWGVTRETAQDVGTWAGLRLEPTSGSTHYFRANADYRLATANYLSQTITRRNSSSKPLNGPSSASARTDWMQEVYFCRGAYRVSQVVDVGTTRPADVGALTLSAEGSHEDRDTAVDDDGYDIAYIQTLTGGPTTIKWMEILIPLFQVIP